MKSCNLSKSRNLLRFIAPLGAIHLTAMAAFAQTSDPLLWRYAVPDWVPRSVSVGDDGGQVFLARGGYGDHVRLLSAFDAATPEPVWQSPTNAGISSRHVTSSAADGNTHFQLRVHRSSHTAPMRVIVEKFTSSSAIRDWSFEFPNDITDATRAGLVLSEDGGRAIAWFYVNASHGTDFAVFDAQSGTPVRYETIQVGSPMRGVALSGDGSHLYLSGYTFTRVYQVETWTMLTQTTSLPGVDNAASISRDGSVYAQSENDGNVRVYRQVEGAYQLHLEHRSTAGSGALVDNVDLSADGRYLACGFDIRPDFLLVHLKVLDLDHPADPVVFERFIGGQGSLDNVTGHLDLSDDGQRLAIALWGDEAGLVDELQVFEQDRGRWQTAFTAPLPGSGLRVQFSADTRTLLVANKSTHANTLATGGDVSLYRMGEPDLVLKGVPSIGNRVTIEHRLAPGMLSRSVFAGNEQDPPIPFPQAGTLYIDRSDLHIFAADTADEGGVARTSYMIPNDPSLIGTTVYFQSFQASPRRLSKDWVKMTILP